MKIAGRNISSNLPAKPQRRTCKSIYKCSHTNTYMHIYKYTCTHIRTQAQKYAHIQSHLCAHTNTYKHTYTNIQAYTSKHTRSHTQKWEGETGLSRRIGRVGHILVYAHIHTCKCTHTHMQLYLSSSHSEV